MGRDVTRRAPEREREAVDEHMLSLY